MTFPEVIDNTIRSAYVKCPTQVLWGHIHHRRIKGTSIHLHAGACFAKGLEVTRKAYWDEGKPTHIAEEEGLKALYAAYGDDILPQGATGDKSLENVVRGFESYWLQYPLGQDSTVPYKASNGKHGIEFSFAAALPVKHPETGNPILYGGRFDLLALYNNALWVQDEKTASSLGEQWMRNWDLDSQFTGYTWGAKQFGYPVAGAIIRGIGLLKTKITHQEAIVFRPDWQIARWHEQLCYDIEDMIRDWKRGYWRKALDKSACNAYGGCQYRTLCESPTPERWLDSHYEVVIWDPVKVTV